ncbi:MAG: tyrosine-type recombinase/integrase [Betaproteobacteria bacterium]|nr:tyrosine-type recombinase/integrase [Betaproteobacteria bacterium]
MNLPVDLANFEPDFDRWLKSQDLALAKLLKNESVTGLEETDARRFEDAVLANLEENGGNKTTVIAWLRIAYLRVKHLRDAGRIDLPSLRLAVSVDPQKSPFVRSRIDRLPQALVWRSMLWNWLKHHAHKASQDDLRCAALVSAVLCGGLLDHRKVYGLYHSFDKTMQFTRSLTFVEFALPYRQLTVDLHQRWFPDPLTEMLLVRGIDRDTPLVSLSLRKLGLKLRAFMEKTGVPKSQLPRSVSGLTESAAIYWESVGSQVDVRYARGLLISQSLKHSVWIRIQSDSGILEPSGSGPSAHGSKDMESPENSAKKEDSPLLSLWWREMFNSLASLSGSGQSLPTILRTCEGIIRAMQIPVPVTAKIPIGWLMAMLNGKTTSGTPFKPDTILDYFQRVVMSLLDVYGERDFIPNEAESLVESYGAILEMLPDGIDKTRTARGLREFHGYLVHHHGFDPLDPVDVFGREAEIAVVEARLISIDDYYQTDRILNESRYQGKDHFLVEAARLAFMLAFRTGMRRMEVFMLRMEDVHLGRQLDVLVRPHANRSLKSLSSKRRIPLDPLLEPDELQRLKAWFEQQQGRNAEYLFATPTGTMISIEGAVDLIHAAMRESTGDPQLHLHHLRHSFATWTYWKLRSVAYPKLAEHFEHLPHTSAYLKTGKKFREQLLPGRPSLPTRGEVYAVSRLLGHSGPNVSLNHYIHGTDLVLHALARRELEKVEGMVLSGASGLPTRSAFRYQNEAAATLLQVFRKRHRTLYHTDVVPPGKPKAKRGRRPSIAQQLSGIETFKQRFELVWRALQLHDARKETSAISIELGSPEPEISRVIENAFTLSRRLGLSTLAPSRPAGARAKVLHDRLLDAVAVLSLENPVLLSDGINIFVEHFSKHKKDVIFRGGNDFANADRYLEFLRVVGIRDEELQLISREESNHHPNLDGWVKALKIPNTVRIKHIAPPNQAKSAYERWIGIQVIHADNKRSAQAVFGAVVAVMVLEQETAMIVAS